MVGNGCMTIIICFSGWAHLLVDGDTTWPSQHGSSLEEPQPGGVAHRPLINVNNSGRNFGLAWVIWGQGLGFGVFFNMVTTDFYKHGTLWNICVNVCPVFYQLMKSLSICCIPVPPYNEDGSSNIPLLMAFVSHFHQITLVFSTHCSGHCSHKHCPTTLLRKVIDNTGLEWNNLVLCRKFSHISMPGLIQNTIDSPWNLWSGLQIASTSSIF